ncbi:hypothetical protein L2E82_44372 [Cichorium intybus]|uniref:Uncharacterized protein n=1 Tax=Cichorium intybus TaxID=13427 RepID=A0ACB8ZQ34_CICIN|nr:hypothetical protein L2E82_44372 [Cichorium intybus]
MSSNTNFDFSSNNSSEPRMASFLNDWIALYASSPFESNNKNIGLLKIPSNDSIKEGYDKNHKKAKNKNHVEIEGNFNIGWWEKETGRRQWSYEEDMLLVQLVQKHGAKNWARVAEKLPLRVGKQCRERWQNYLRPNIMKNAWSEEEDKLLISLHQQFGNKWADMARRMPGRTENNIKNHWNATKRKQFSSKNREKTKSPSLLKDYITSITSTSHDNQINIQQQRTVADPTTDSGVAYKPAEVAPHESGFDFDFDDVSSRLVDELVFDPTKEMDFLKLFCQ